MSQLCISRCFFLRTEPPHTMKRDRGEVEGKEREKQPHLFLEQLKATQERAQKRICDYLNLNVNFTNDSSEKADKQHHLSFQVMNELVLSPIY